MRATLIRCFTVPLARRKQAYRLVNDIPTSSLHYDLESFLEYAKERSLRTNSTTYVGTHYEYTVKEALEAFGMSLERTGGCDDRGIDLRGIWTIPNLPSETSQKPRRYATLVQCKYLRARPSDIREVEGTVASKEPNTIGVLASPKPCTPGIRRHMISSLRPLMYVCLQPGGEKVTLEQIVWNSPANELLPGVGVRTKYMKNRHEAVLVLDGHEFGSPIFQNPRPRRRESGQ